MKLDADTARILLSLVIAFHDVDVKANLGLGAEERAALVLTEEEADRGLAIIERDFDADIAAVGRAIVETPAVSRMLRDIAAAVA